MLKSILSAFVLACLLSGTAAAQNPKEHYVVVPTDDKPFAVSETDYVRLTGEAISGSQIKIEIKGPAEVDMIYFVKKVSGENPLLGMQIKQYDLKPTGKGKVNVTITAKFPDNAREPKVTKFEFQVK